MQSKTIRVARGFFCWVTMLAGAQLVGTSTVSAQVPTPPPPQLSTPHAPPAQPQKSALDLLIWDSVLKEATPAPGAPTANFFFAVTNETDANVVIDRVQTSCGCTVAKLPSQPWVLVPHTNGQINVTVNLAGKSGTVWKTITVFSTNNTSKILTVKVNLPENPQMARIRNQQMAQVDPQAIFRGDCAKCHVDKGRGLFGKALYKEDCGICHEAVPRASMVPDLHALNHPADYAFWKTIIAEGKPRTMMPGFSDKHGGPLTDEQIESLAKVLTAAFPGNGNGAGQPMPIKTSAANPVRPLGAPGLPPPPVKQN